MNAAELTALIDRLRAEPRETEWLEFKANRFEPQVLGVSHTLVYQGKRLVIFEIHPAFDRPVEFYGTAHIRVGTSKTTLANHSEKQRQLWMRLSHKLRAIENAGSRKKPQWILTENNLAGKNKETKDRKQSRASK